MTLRQYLIIMGLGTLLCASALAVIVFQVDPYTADTLSMGLFYACIACTLVGICSLLILPIIQISSKRRDMLLHKHVTKSLRLSITVSFLLTLLLLLQGERLLSPVTGIALLALICFILVIRTTVQKRTSIPS